MTSLSRACKGCNQLKVRCQPSTADPSCCERCLSGGRACVPADRRRRPRDRIAELEAQVAALSRALEKQTISPENKNKKSSDKDGAAAATEEFALVENVYSFGRGTDTEALPAGEAALAFLDARVPMHAQNEALVVFRQRCQHMVPALSRDTNTAVDTDVDTDLAVLRRDRPILLFTMVMFSSAPSIASGAVGSARDQLLREVTCMFAAEIIAEPASSRPEIVWALLVACFWFRAQPGGAHTTVHQLSQMASSMVARLDAGAGPRSSEAQRASLACFAAASSLAIGIRRPDRHAAWTPQHEACLEALSSASAASSRQDELFLHTVRGERLCHRVAAAVHLCEPAYHWDLAADTGRWRTTVAVMQQEIDDWTAASCHRRSDAAYLALYRHAAIVYLYEPVLHTPTNKMTFGAPFRAEKMAEADFARPAPDAVSGGHVAALYALRDACHALLDLATADAAVSRFLADSPLPYVAKVFHAVLVLAKLHIAVTGPGNTYGAVLRADELRLAAYPGRIARLAAECEQHNPGSLNARIFACCAGMGEWLAGYDARVASPSASTTPPPTSEQLAVPGLEGYMTAYDHHGFDMDEVEWQLLDSYLDSGGV